MGYWQCLGTAKWLSDNDLSFIQHDTFSSFAYASVAFICLKNNTGSIKARKSLLAALAVGEIRSEDSTDGSQWILLSGLGLSKRAELRTWDSPSLILQLVLGAGWPAVLVRFEKVYCGSWYNVQEVYFIFMEKLVHRFLLKGSSLDYLFQVNFFFFLPVMFQAWFNSWT